VQGSNQTILAIGPGLTGLVIGGLGIGVAILLDAFTFAYTSVALLFMRLPKPMEAEKERQSTHSMLSDILEMGRYVTRDAVLRPYMLLILGFNVFLIGPITVGPVVLAQDRFDGSAAALGLMLSALGAGAVLGALATNVIKIRRFGTLYMETAVVVGIELALIGVVINVWIISLLIAIIGFLLGFTNVLLLTWFGNQIPPEMMGRFMSLYVLLGVGMAPISNALAGFTFSVSFTGTFIVAGSMIALIAIWGMLNPNLRQMRL
jgi:hypothetical protein